MPPKKSTGAGAGAAGTRSKRSALGQPTLSFAQQRKATSSAKGSKTKSAGQQQQRTQSTESITVHESTPSPKPEPTLELEAKGDGVTLQNKTEDEKSEKVERKKLNPKSKEWAGVYGDAKAAMGNMEPIHAGPDTHNQVHHILRVFDMTSKYGPSVGITRLQRWERAQKWGLNPPKEIKSILTTKEGEEDASYRENVLHTWL